MNTKKIGDIAELKIITALIKSGYEVSVPVGDCCRYDLVFQRYCNLPEYDNLTGEGLQRFQRVQVKNGRIRNGVIYTRACSVSTKKGNTVVKHYKNDVDFIGVYCPDNDKCYLVPISIVGISNISLRILPTENNQSKDINWASDYEIDG